MSGTAKTVRKTAEVKSFVPVITHTPEQIQEDDDAFWAIDGRDWERRGVWEEYGGFQFNTHSRVSCAIGLAEVHHVEDLDKVKALVRQLGKVFLFTVTEPKYSDYYHNGLWRAINEDPSFKIVVSGESWMRAGGGNHNPVHVFVYDPSQDVKNAVNT